MSVRSRLRICCHSRIRAAIGESVIYSVFEDCGAKMTTRRRPSAGPLPRMEEGRVRWDRWAGALLFRLCNSRRDLRKTISIQQVPVTSFAQGKSVRARHRTHGKKVKTYAHLLVIKIANVVCEVCLEASGHVGSACISSTEERVPTSRPIYPSTRRHVVHIAQNGHIDRLFRVAAVVHSELRKRKDALTILFRVCELVHDPT